MLLSGNVNALNAYQNEIYQGCLETSQHVSSKRAKQYCRCITLTVTDKYTIEQLERAALTDQKKQNEMFSFAVNYCNLNANALGNE
ncbi:hypothetical protein OAY91_00465 [Candidatus Pelagibacter sp.]|nr:hypothetical protein [Candidatus Pelagibacter sp.]